MSYSYLFLSSNLKLSNITEAQPAASKAIRDGTVRAKRLGYSLQINETKIEQIWTQFPALPRNSQSKNDVPKNNAIMQFETKPSLSHAQPGKCQ